MIVLPAMSQPQTASWHGVMDLHERLDYGWTLVGGQMVHLQCAERDYAAPRPTDDVDTVIDVLLPDGIGERAASRTGATGSPTIAAPGGTQALDRSESVPVSVEGHEGFVRRPTIVGALVMKAAAHTAVSDPAKGRHRFDFATLAALVAARDFRDVSLSKKDRRRLSDMLAATRADLAVMSGLSDVEESLNRLERAAKLRTNP